MISEKFERLIAKYLVNQATFLELNELELWVKNPDNEKEFIKYVKTNYAIEYNLKKFNPDKTKNVIIELIKEEKRALRMKRIKMWSKYAAVFAGIIIFTFTFKSGFFSDFNKDNTLPVKTNSNTSITPGTDKATLKLEDGSSIVLEKGNTYQTKNASSNGENITYTSKNNASREIAYNYLTIPRGGQFHIVLADGTEVWLNSDSQLKYPVAFVDGVDRQVELVYGEAYFDVSPSTAHKGSKFKVLNQSQEVEVLGTEFNIKAYKDENSIYTTLVEGKVEVSTLGIKQNLTPNQQSVFNKNTERLEVSTVDVFNEISWKDGIFSFEDESLQEIMKVLSRWYDMEVIFKNENIKTEEFFGLLRKDQSIEKIISTIKDFGTIERYEFKDKILMLE